MRILKFTGDARREMAISEVKSKIEAAAQVGVVPPWEDVDKAIEKAVECNWTYIYAKAATSFAAGMSTGETMSYLH